MSHLLELQSPLEHHRARLALEVHEQVNVKDPPPFSRHLIVTRKSSWIEQGILRESHAASNGGSKTFTERGLKVGWSVKVTCFIADPPPRLRQARRTPPSRTCGAFDDAIKVCLLRSVMRRG